MGSRGMHDWQLKLNYSRGVRERTDLETLRDLIPGCISVIKTDPDTDRSGTDYVATLRRGAEIWIDAKTREPGASRWWEGSGPELALEIWSVRPGGKYRTPEARAKVGWTLNEASQTDMVYYTFDPSDTDEVFLIPFQHLRIAFRQFWPNWKAKYRIYTQDSYQWESQCIFVPANVVLRAIDSVTRCHITREMRI